MKVSADEIVNKADEIVNKIVGAVIATFVGLATYDVLYERSIGTDDIRLTLALLATVSAGRILGRVGL
jgi:hypothetical protein